MKRSFIATIMLLSLSSHAAVVPAFSCVAHCLNVNWSAHTIFSIGSLEGLATDKRKAFGALTTRCERRLRLYGLSGNSYLAQGDFSAFHHRTTVEHGRSTIARGVVYNWNFSSAHATSISSWEIRTEEDLRVQMNLASPQNSCEAVEVDETELVPYYEGTEVILGRSKN